MRLIAAWLLLSGSLLSAQETQQEEEQPPPKESRERRMAISCEEDSFINAETTPENLVRRVQERNVARQEVEIGEGITEAGIVLFPEVPQRRLELIWRPQPRELVARIRSKESLWKSAAGLGIGTSLKQLERLNGRRFTMAGFGWDYSGTVTSWQGGKLDPKDDKCRFLVRLDYNHEAPGAQARNNLASELQGDGEFTSRNPSMQKLNPRVYEIVVTWQLPPAPVEEAPATEPPKPTETPEPPKQPQEEPKAQEIPKPPQDQPKPPDEQPKSHDKSRPENQPKPEDRPKPPDDPKPQEAPKPPDAPGH